MKPLPIRGLGTLGALPDLNPFDTPSHAASKVRNVRFYQDNVFSSPVFKELGAATRFAQEPLHLFLYSAIDSTVSIQMLTDDGKVYTVSNNTLIDVGPTTPLITGGAVTSCRLGNVTYLNVAGDTPHYRGGSTATYEPLPGWDLADNARSLRAYKDFLVALNLSKGAAEYPAMIKWSDAAQAGAPPSNWDVASLDSLAGETVLNDATGPLVDGAALGDSFILYTTEEAYRMDYVGKPFVFSFTRLPNTEGLINANCVCEAAGQHFYMSDSDIVTLNGVSSQSIAEGRVRRHIFSRLDRSRSSDFFVLHAGNRSEIMFCYVTKSDLAHFPSYRVTGCNEAAVFNYANNTWTFVDLPSAKAGMSAALPSIKDWDALTNWNDTDATWASLQGESLEVPLWAVSGDEGQQASLLFYDDAGGGLLPNQIREDYLIDGFIEIGLKEFDEYGIPITAWKAVQSIYPQVLSNDLDDALGIRIGGSANPQSDTTLDKETMFNPSTDNKRNSRVCARYLMFRFRFPKGRQLQLSGFDLDMSVKSMR